MPRARPTHIRSAATARCAGLVLLSPYRSINTLVGTLVRTRAPAWSACVAWLAEHVVVPTVFDTEGAIASLRGRCPAVLVIHGDRDTTIDMEAHGKVVYEAARAAGAWPCAFHCAKATGHNDFDTERDIVRPLAAWLADVRAAAAASASLRV
jgi:hypothetical protein